MTPTSVFLRSAGRLGCEMAVGAIAAGVLGTAPAAGAVMAAVACLIVSCCSVRDAFEHLPFLDEHGLREYIGRIALLGSWCATMAQVSQFFVKTSMGAAVPFYASFVIVTSALILGDSIVGYVESRV